MNELQGLRRACITARDNERISFHPELRHWKSLARLGIFGMQKKREYVSPSSLTGAILLVLRPYHDLFLAKGKVLVAIQIKTSERWNPFFQTPVEKLRHGGDSVVPSSSSTEQSNALTILRIVAECAERLAEDLRLLYQFETGIFGLPELRFAGGCCANFGVKQGTVTY